MAEETLKELRGRFDKDTNDTTAKLLDYLIEKEEKESEVLPEPPTTES